MSHHLLSHAVLPAAALALVAVACGAPGNEGPAPAAAPPVVELVVRGLEFEGPSEIPSGWTTFRLVNDSEMTHFALVERMPEGFGLAAHQEQVAPVFQQGFDLLVAGKTDEAMAKFGELPEWFGEIVFLGGPGLVAPHGVAEATVRLEPGTYLVECYVKTRGLFHSYNPSPDVYGMVHELTVTGEPSETPEPEPTALVTISSEGGIAAPGTLPAGRHVFAVTFADQIVHENFVGHDVHLARLAADTDLDVLAAWMDWSRPKGLETPAPVVFVGGTNELPAGTTGYFTADLEPGRYALVAEVTKPREKGMLVELIVEPGS